MTRSSSRSKLSQQTCHASVANFPRAFPGAMPRPFGERFSNCIWCDATDHMRQLCPAFMDVLREGKVRYNENWRLVNIATGEELPLNFGRGGLKNYLEDRDQKLLCFNSRIIYDYLYLKKDP